MEYLSDTAWSRAEPTLDQMYANVTCALEPSLQQGDEDYSRNVYEAVIATGFLASALEEEQKSRDAPVFRDRLVFPLHCDDTVLPWDHDHRAVLKVFSRYAIFSGDLRFFRR